MSILVNQLRVDKLGQSQKSQSNSKQRHKDDLYQQTKKELKSLEHKINTRWTGKLTSVVDKLGQLIKKQEARLAKVQKQVKEMKQSKKEPEKNQQQELKKRATSKSALNDYHVTNYNSKYELDQDLLDLTDEPYKNDKAPDQRGRSKAKRASAKNNNSTLGSNYSTCRK